MQIHAGVAVDSESFQVPARAGQVGGEVKAEPIEVRFNVNDYPPDMPFNHPMWEMWVVGKLKEAGIPVDGTFLYRGIKSGTLSRMDDPMDFGGYVYRWTP
jgi:hypothetical protein